MKRISKTILAAATAIGLTASFAGCASGDNDENGGGGGAPNDTIVAEQTFDLITIDPARAFELSAGLIMDQIYESALEFDNGDLSKVVDGLCSYEMSEDNKVLTLKLVKKDAKFSNGDPVTVDDIVFSYQRLYGIGGNPSFLLEGITIEKVDDETLTLTSDGKAELVYILPNINIVNSKVVQENGGTTDETDAAQDFLDKNSQGSGPYMIESYNPDSEVVMVPNEHYAGDEPKYKRIVIKNVSGDTQLTDIQSGQAQVAFSLNQDQIANIDESMVTVQTIPSTRSVYIFSNDDPSVNEITANEDFREALLYAVDYDKVLQLAGEGAQRLASLVPNEFVGAVPTSEAPNRDLDKAKELLEKAGYNGEAIPFHYASDGNVGGVDIALLAESLQAQVKEAGINLDLKPAPGAAQLDGARSGKQPMGIGSWGADYPDPANYLVFTPGESLAMRAGWTAEAAPEVMELVDAAVAATGDERDAAYKELYTKMLVGGVYVPLVQPAQSVVVNKSITNFVSNADHMFWFAAAE